MAAGAHVVFLSQLLRLMPSPLVAALDAWSYRLALRRAARRRQRVAHSSRKRQSSTS